MKLIKVSKILLALFATTAYCLDDYSGHKCTHDLQDHPEPELLDVAEDFIEGESHEGRSLQDYPHFRTYGYYGLLQSTTSAYRDYFSTLVIPPILDYFTSALKIKYPVSDLMTVSSSRVCSVNTPSILKNGIATDFFFFIEIDYDTSSNWVASSSACTLASGTRRPLIAKTTINRNLMKVASNDVLLHEKNVICVMHEIVHTLGFSNSHFNNFLDSNGRKRSGHVTSAMLDGASSTVLNVEPLTSRLREHFGCPTLKGAYMENSGSSGTRGSHFERKMFSFEFMTSGLIYQMQVSQFTLALLEGSGWYVADYSYADAFSWGQGQGCDFLTGYCSANSFSEFCSGSGKRCANPGRGGGSCESDSRSNNCKFIHPSVSLDCENESAGNSARLKSVEVYGRGEGSKCFDGTLSSSSSSASATTYCFKYTCNGSGLDTTLTVKFGSESVECTRKGEISVDGYRGYLNCPDPLTFCSTVGAKVCPRGCMGRGQCVDGVCQCISGYRGTDCSLTI